MKILWFSHQMEIKNKNEGIKEMAEIFQFQCSFTV